MTNEQAKKMLIAKLECLKRETSGTDFDCNNSNCDECPLCYEQGNMREQKEALDLAIKALEQQHCDDTISRDAAIDIERNATVDTNPSHFEAHQKFTQYVDDAEISSFGRWQWANGFNTALTAVVIGLRKLPSAQPEQRKGEWIDEGFYADGHGAHAFRCSECGGHIIEYDADPFCRWCGADMRGEQNG